jgi:hypothetical protein
MVGGPAHGAHYEVPWPDPPTSLQVARPQPPFEVWMHTERAELQDIPELPALYTLRFYGLGDQQHLPAYVCPEQPGIMRLPARASEDDYHYARIAESLWRQHLESLIPPCVVPGCGQKGRSVFIAAERGRLAGQHWQPGDRIPLCPGHASDVYMAAGVMGYDRLPGWLQPDAKWDTEATFDGGRLDYGAARLAQTARILHLGIPTQERQA